MCVLNKVHIPAVVSQNVTNKSCLVCVKSEKYESWVTFTPQLNRCCQGEAEMRILDFKPRGESSRCQVRLLPPRRSRGAYTQFQNHMVKVLDAKSECFRRGEAEVRILIFKTTWSEFHNLPRVGPKQLCASAHLGCTRVAGTS